MGGVSRRNYQRALGLCRDASRKIGARRFEPCDRDGPRFGLVNEVAASPKVSPD